MEEPAGWALAESDCTGKRIVKPTMLRPLAKELSEKKKAKGSSKTVIILQTGVWGATFVFHAEHRVSYSA